MQHRRRRFTRWFAGFGIVLLAGVLGVWLAVLGLGIAIPLDGFREDIEATVSRALGRPVQIDGPVLLRPTIGPTIVAQDVRLSAPTGPGDLLRAGRIAVRFAPVALLRGEPLGRRLQIDDATIELSRTATDAAHADVEPVGEYAWSLPAIWQLLRQQTELQQLGLDRVALIYRDDSGEGVQRLEIDALNLDTRPGRALELMLRGRFQQQPFHIDLTGGQFVDLLTPSGPWPWQARLKVAETRFSMTGQLLSKRHKRVTTFDLAADWPAELARLAAWFPQRPLTGQLALSVDRSRSLTLELRLPALDTVVLVGEGARSSGPTSRRPTADANTPAGPVMLPLMVSIADVAFKGRLMLTRRLADSALELTASDVDAGRLIASLSGTSDIHGRFRRIGFRADLGGRGGTGILNRVAVTLRITGGALAYGNGAAGRQVDLTLDELALTLPAGESVLMSVRGRLLDEAFTMDLMAGGLAALLVEENWPMTVSGAGGGAVLELSGSVAALRADEETRLSVGVFGQRIGEMAAWLGVSPCATGSYTLRGQLVLAEDVGRLQFVQVQLDGSRLNAELDWSGYEQTDVLNAVLHFEELQPADIVAFIPLFDQSTARRFVIELPVLPASLEIDNADIKLTMEHLPLRMVEFTDVALSGRIRQGRLQPSPFDVGLGNATFQGYLDPAGEEPSLVFEDVAIDSGVGKRMDKLFSSAMRLVGDSAVVPLRWLFSTKVTEEESLGCEVRGDETAQ